MEKNFFDELSKRAYAEGAGVPELNELWGHTFGLQQWFFIGRGPLDHPYPYIASRPDICEGKNMIRAFTDENKLTEFVKENDLLEPDHSIRMLTIPTGGIISWLEGFARHDVHGIWFNSNHASHGYFAPVLQLQAIKDYLDKTWTRNPSDN